MGLRTCDAEGQARKDSEDIQSDNSSQISRNNASRPLEVSLIHNITLFMYCITSNGHPSAFIIIYVYIFYHTGTAESGIICLNVELNKSTFLRDEMFFFYFLFATNKADLILNRPIACSCNDTIYSKSIKKNRKKYHF